MLHRSVLQHWLRFRVTRSHAERRERQRKKKTSFFGKYTYTIFALQERNKREGQLVQIKQGSH